jgi:hypothetical protein
MKPQMVIHYLSLTSVAAVVIGVAVLCVAGAFYLFGEWGWIVVVGASWFLWSWYRWHRKTVGQRNELEWLDEFSREHEEGTHDHTDILERLIDTIEREHEPSPDVNRRVERAWQVLHERKLMEDVDRKLEEGIRRETDPFESKIRQALKLKWKKTAEVTKDREGAPFMKRSVRFIRGKEGAVLWHKDATITLVRLHLPVDFDDFIELEEFIAKHPREADLDDATGELRYLREMELFFVMHGYRDDIMHIQATDYAFLVAFGELFKAGYAAGEDSGVLAALVLHAIQFYKQDRERTIRWLTRTTEDLNRARPGGD